MTLNRTDHVHSIDSFDDIEIGTLDDIREVVYRYRTGIGYTPWKAIESGDSPFASALHRIVKLKRALNNIGGKV